jgi:CheY-like chemotaxis protein
MPGQELRVLVIDDEPDIAAMLVDSIEFLGYRARVIAAATAGTVEQPQADRRAG